ncbi:hypothetical protein HMPREF3034_01815 [Prevotella sp. DNF00663]|nr:hypothetical protein HMPREF3034_01815 [Prevotella sp. DNF00663]
MLIDGIRGYQEFNSGRWLSFDGFDVDVTIDLLKPAIIQKVDFNVCVIKNEWAFDARSFKVLISNDGTTFREIRSTESPLKRRLTRRHAYTFFNFSSDTSTLCKSTNRL